LQRNAARLDTGLNSESTLKVNSMKNVNNRLRRARKTRAKIAELKVTRLSVHRTNTNIYAQIIAETGDRVLASASTVEAEVRQQLKNGGNIEAATLIGKRIAEKAAQAGITTVAFDRSGYKYHGRIKALAEAARETGLKF
jgi:large subunit ribosomal protein L18